MTLVGSMHKGREMIFLTKDDDRQYLTASGCVVLCASENGVK